MAVRNNLTNRNQNPAAQQQNNEPAPMRVEYQWGDTTIALDAATVRQYLVSGGGNATDQELAMFINLCRYQHLNPFLKEAYLIKFGNSPASIVVGKETFQKRAFRNPKFEGYQAGVIIYKQESGEFEYRTGALAIGNEQLVGGWAKVYVKGYQVPIETAITYREYAGRKGNGEVNQQWQTKPATMLRKVAMVQALREAFPEDLGGLYDADELNIELNDATIVPAENPQPEPAGLPQGGTADVMPEARQVQMEELENF